MRPYLLRWADAAAAIHEKSCAVSGTETNGVKEDDDSGVWLVPLADLSKKADQERVLPSRVGKIIGAPEQANRPPLEKIAEYLTNGTFILI